MLLLQSSRMHARLRARRQPHVRPKRPRCGVERHVRAAMRQSRYLGFLGAPRTQVAEDADGEEPVLTLAEAMAREEAAEAEAAVASLNDRRDEWEPCVDNATGATYYVHYQTGESSWEKPTAAN